MAISPKPELISFKLCPFVQRSVITLLEKGVEFDITYIDLAEPPEWFLQISPLGKVPVLRVGDEVLFESAVINDYLDEVNSPSLHPADPLAKAQNRAWIEFTSNLIIDQYQLMIAATEEEYHKADEAIRTKLRQLEQQLTTGAYFNGEEFSLVDAAIAPVFMRFEILGSWHEMAGLYQDTPKVDHWQQTLLQRSSVQNSVVEEFSDELRLYIAEHGTFAASLFTC
ncbi:MAG: glutathione S-transferase family protein [Gammaproteobacteria bacterium]|nr:glutathione S-transferase family protein [Gammaproteobacteria bacterium]